MQCIFASWTCWHLLASLKICKLAYGVGNFCLDCNPFFLAFRDCLKSLLNLLGHYPLDPPVFSLALALTNTQLPRSAYVVKFTLILSRANVYNSFWSAYCKIAVQKICHWVIDTEFMAFVNLTVETV